MTSPYCAPPCQTYIHFLTHYKPLRPRLYENENLAWNSSFWDQGNTVQILGLQHFKLMRKLHVRLAFMLTVTLNAWRLSFVEDQRGRVRRLELLTREDYRIEPSYLGLLDRILYILRCIAGGVPLGMGCARMPHFHKKKYLKQGTKSLWCSRERQLAARCWQFLIPI